MPVASRTTASATEPARRSPAPSSNRPSTRWSASEWSRNSRCAGRPRVLTYCSKCGPRCSTTNSPTLSGAGIQRSPNRPTHLSGTGSPRSLPRFCSLSQHGREQQPEEFEHALRIESDQRARLRGLVASRSSWIDTADEVAYQAQARDRDSVALGALDNIAEDRLDFERSTRQQVTRHRRVAWRGRAERRAEPVD